MAMTLVFKRSKNFVSDAEDGTKKFLAQANPSHPQQVPFWVAATATYRQGIKDGSIVNLTPPHLMPGYKAPVAAEEAIAEPTQEELEAADAAEAAPAQTEAPQAPFGGQPMTPVQPAPKIGRVSSGSGKGK